jgi:endoglucanase
MEKSEFGQRMSRRGMFLGGACLAGLSGRAALAETGDVAVQWQVFHTRFLTSDGRIVDTGNGGVSHSEGQGWGLLFAEAAGDLKNFDLINGWTETHLARPHDALHAWRYDPSAANPVADLNNATDGDIFIAWAKARAARRWSRPVLADSARAIVTDILGKLCLRADGQLFLLPGADGFLLPGRANLNLSYYVWPAFATLAALVPSDSWRQLENAGLALLERGRFGIWSLPPDWLALDRQSLSVALAPDRPPRFSYDAIRVPLWLSWAGLMPTGFLTAFGNYWRAPSFPYHPAWVDLKSGAYSNYPAPSGMDAVARLTLAAAGQAPALPDVAAASDYYSASLTLLTHVAAQ